MNNMSPQLQNQIAQFQQVQQQLQTVATQKMQMEAQKRELERTKEELSKSTGDVYKSVGSLLIKADNRETLLNEIEESMETMGIRIKALDRQEKGLREKFTSLQETINKQMGSQ
ncbi:MAG: prefoldin subunit beta [Methanomassiliicoccaceae archaeon]|jgi:prefoldin beta subunit|nr:prefoldin subunit beta [Methanomassiliicoccaceae archaeon]